MMVHLYCILTNKTHLNQVQHVLSMSVGTAKKATAPALRHPMDAINRINGGGSRSSKLHVCVH